MLRGNRGPKTERRNEFSGGAVDGTSCGRAPTALRVYGDVPLHFSAVDDGAGAPARLPEDQGAAHGGRALQPRGAILGANFRDQFCPWRDHRHPDGIPVRDELGGVLQGGRRRHRADAGNGGGLFFFSGVELSRIVFVWREEAWPHWPLVGGVSCISGLVAFGLSDRGDGCVDATSDGLPERRRPDASSWPRSALFICSRNAMKPMAALSCERECL